MDVAVISVISLFIIAPIISFSFILLIKKNKKDIEIMKVKKEMMDIELQKEEFICNYWKKKIGNTTE